MVEIVCEMSVKGPGGHVRCVIEADQVDETHYELRRAKIEGRSNLHLRIRVGDETEGDEDLTRAKTRNFKRGLIVEKPLERDDEKGGETRDEPATPFSVALES